MLNINGITVRLGGRLILDRATAAIPPGARVRLIGQLMGKNPEHRFNFIQVNAANVSDDEIDA